MLHTVRTNGQWTLLGLLGQEKGTCPLTRKYYENNFLRIIFRNF